MTSVSSTLPGPHISGLDANLDFVFAFGTADGFHFSQGKELHVLVVF